MNLSTEKPNPDRVIIVGSYQKNQVKAEFDELLEETILLAQTANLIVEEVFTQGLAKYKSDTYIGKGKLAEITTYCKNSNIFTLIFVDNLTPAQAKYISKATEANVVDRTELILSIFAKHAQTSIAMIQVELAQLEYSYSKLKNLWQHFSRIVGGVGTKGPGESQLEIDRRLVRKRISFLKNKAEKLKSLTHEQRKNREGFFKVTLVGYTNAGKSTLFNTLTKSDIYVADKLFATLDSKSKLLYNEAGKVIITDTIGFIRNLPTILISSFYSTLTDVVDADLLLHVVDASAPGMERRIEEVNKVIKDINADDVPVLMVFNKMDTIKGLASKFLLKNIRLTYVNSVFISALEKSNIKAINPEIQRILLHNEKEKKIEIPIELKSLISFLDKKYTSNKKLYLKENMSYEYTFNMSDSEFLEIKKQVDKYHELQFINS
ncbi:MAG: GTPase HflX [Candidatus Cloacimonadales bacterium]